MKRNSQSGFTLIEVLVAVGLVGIVGTTGVRAIQSMIAFQGANTKSSRAIVLAQDEAEDLRRLDYDDIATGSSTTTDGYTIDWVVTEDPVLATNGPVELGMKLIEITVSWKSKGVPQSYGISTVFTQLSSI